MISVVIRNKNEAFYLNKILFILNTVYHDDIDEIIVVDNNSTDDSIKIAEQNNCKIVSISNFTYGRAINLGISNARNNYILLLSSHSIPIGKSFFKNTLDFLKNNANAAGIRYINSYENYERALNNDYIVKEPLKYGLMAACCIVVKEVWEQCKFNEDLEFSEDKEWSEKTIKLGYDIFDLNETFFYFIKRDKASSINRFKNETLVYYKLHKVKPPNKLKIIASFFKKVFIKNTLSYFRQLVTDFKRAKAHLSITNKLKKDNWQ